MVEESDAGLPSHGLTGRATALAAMDECPPCKGGLKDGVRRLRGQSALVYSGEWRGALLITAGPRLAFRL
jgi:hypothetical protein